MRAQKKQSRQHDKTADPSRQEGTHAPTDPNLSPLDEIDSNRSKRDPVKFSFFAKSVVSHAQVAAFGLACTALTFFGALYLYTIGQKAAEQRASLAIATTAIKSGLENAHTALKTSAMSGNRDFLVHYNDAWTEQILPYQKSISDTLRDSAIPVIYTDEQTAVTEDWSAISQMLHQLNSTQTSLNTLLLESYTGRVYHIPAENFMTAGNNIIRLAIEISEKELTKQSGLEKQIENFQDSFHKAHADAMLYFLAETSPNMPSQTDTRLKLAQRRLNELEAAWPNSDRDDRTLIDRLKSMYNDYQDNVVEAMNNSRNVTAQNQIQTFLAVVTKDTDAVIEKINDMQTKHEHYISSGQRWAENAQIALGIVALLLMVSSFLISYRSSKRLARAVTTPITRQTALLDGFQHTYDYVEAEISGQDEIAELMATSNRVRESISKYLHRLEETLENKKLAHKRTTELLEYTSYIIKEHAKRLIGAMGHYYDSHADSPPDKDDALKHIQRHTDGLAAQADRLKLYAGLDLNKIGSHDEPVDLVTLTESALADIAAPAALKNLKLVNVIDPAIPSAIITDKAKIQIILSEILENAVAYTDEGGICLSVNAGETREGTCDLHIAIENTSGGLPAMTADNLATYPLARQNTPIPPGTADSSPTLGLGLVLASRLAQSLSAQIETESLAPSGSSVHLKLTVRTQSDIPVGAERAVENTQILVLERQPFLFSKLDQQLSAWTMPVTHIATPKELAERLSSKKFRDQPFSAILIGDSFTAGRLEDLDQIMRALQKTFKHAKCVLTTGQVRDPAQMSHPVYRRNICLNGPVYERHLFKALTRTAGISDTPQDIADQLRAVPGQPGAAATPRPAPLRPETGLTPHRDRPVHILLADNEDGYHVVLSNLLRRLGYECDRVASGEDALSAVTARHFDLILMSVGLSGMNGLEAARHIRARTENANTPILALAPQEMHRELDLFKSAGMNGHMVKPVDIDTLDDVIRRYVA